MGQDSDPVKMKISRAGTLLQPSRHTNYRHISSAAANLKPVMQTRTMHWGESEAITGCNAA